MQCSTCHGRHFLPTISGIAPCPECQGAGAAHCCDGLACQPGEDEFMVEANGDGKTVAA